MRHLCDICQSVCHVHHMHFVHSILKRRKKFIFYGEVTPYASEWCTTVVLIRWIGKGQGHEEWKCKSLFAHIIVTKWIDLHKTDAKKIAGLFYTSSNTPCIVSCCIIAKNWGCRWNISARGSRKKVFQTYTQPRLQTARGRHLCHFVDGGLAEVHRFFREKVFHICAISVQISQK